MDGVIGVMAVQSYHDPMCYGQLDMDVMVSIADQIAAAISRKRAEKDLFFKEHVIKSSSSALATCDLEGKMTFGNPFFQKLWGFDDPREYLGKPFTELWLLGDEYEEIMRALRVEGIWAGELKALRKDGTFFDVHVSTATVYDDEGDSVALTKSVLSIVPPTQHPIPR
jgi:PAS domain S-box-containing protein